MSQKTKILIMDDNSGIRSIIKTYLNKQGDMEVIGEAGDGQEGIKIIYEKEPQVVVLDMIMPKLDGLGVLEEINLGGPVKPPHFICLSAIGQEELMQKATALGAKYYMVKPFDLELL